MNKVAVIVLADTESHESLGRVVNALELAKELTEHNDEVKIIFDGAGTKWIPKLEDSEHDAHPLYNAVKENIHGACRFCSKAFGVFKEVKSSGVTLLDEYEQHPSLRNYITNGYQIVTF
ncbi:DsrE family protein [Fodinibius salsisoli]|uniref:DsrE family protein n=1 Tax=Fodinibius salsisoli TaxID=2820877 RepID=A0ABT3PSC8_9BACT|nr:DsrE family protein [Fodinibius salsisoli]MCW9708774.1 DsrE family protein [Fodinibius salsisoli]